MIPLLYRVSAPRKVAQLVHFIPFRSGFERSFLGLSRANLAPPRATLRSFSGQAGDSKSLHAIAQRQSPVLEKVPRIGTCKTVAAVLDVHATLGPKLKPTDLSACWNHVGKLVSNRHERQWLKNNQSLLDPLMDQTKLDIDQLNAKSLANIAHGIAKIAAATDWDPGPGTWKKLEEQILNSIDDVSFQGCVNIMWAFTKVGSAAPTLYDAVAHRVAPRLHEFDPQSISNIAWAFATAKHAAPILFDAIASAALPNLHDHNSRNIATLAWAFSTAGHSAPALFDAIEETTAPRLNEFKAQAISMTVWAFSTGGHSAPVLFDAVAKTAAPRLHEFNPQALSNTAWAFATAGHPAPALFNGLAKAALPQLHTFNPQDFANTAWAFATAGHPAPALFNGLAKAALPQLHKFKPQQLSNLAWAYAKAEHDAPYLYDIIAKVAIPKLRTFNPQALSSTAWAFATAGHPAPALFNGLAKAALPQLHTFNPQALSNTAWAFATAGHPAPALFNGLAKAALPQLQKFKPQELSNLAWAYARMNHEEARLFECIARNVAPQLLEVESRQLANFAWSYATFDFQAEVLFGTNSPFRNLCAARTASFSHEGLCQLHQWQLWRHENCIYDDFPVDLQHRCHKAFTEVKGQPSNLQSKVVNVLTILDDISDVQEEVQMASGYSVDAMVTFQDRTIGIEVDGPSHFVGRTHAPKGPTRLKRRQLWKLDNLHLLSIPYWKWDGKSEDELKKYLQTELSRVRETI